MKASEIKISRSQSKKTWTEFEITDADFNWIATAAKPLGRGAYTIVDYDIDAPAIIEDMEAKGTILGTSKAQAVKAIRAAIS